METKKYAGQWMSTYHVKDLQGKIKNNNETDTQALPPESQLVILINEVQVILYATRSESH